MKQGQVTGWHPCVIDAAKLALQLALTVAPTTTGGIRLTAIP